MHNLLVKDIFIRKNSDFTWGKYTFYSGVASNGLSMQYIFPMEQSLLKWGRMLCQHMHQTFPGFRGHLVSLCLYLVADGSILESTIVSADIFYFSRALEISMGYF